MCFWLIVFQVHVFNVHLVTLHLVGQIQGVLFSNTNITPNMAKSILALKLVWPTTTSLNCRDTHVLKAISQSGGIFAHTFIPFNGSAMQNRALKSLENVRDFLYGHHIYPPEGTQLGDIGKH